MVALCWMVPWVFLGQVYLYAWTPWFLGCSIFLLVVIVLKYLKHTYVCCYSANFTLLGNWQSLLGWSCLSLNSLCCFEGNCKITEYPRLERTHKYHWVQLPAPCRITYKWSMWLTALSRHLNSHKLAAMNTFLGILFQVPATLSVKNIS